MDLPMDKAKLLKQYDLEKKWDMICDQVSFHFPELSMCALSHAWHLLDGKTAAHYTLCDISS